MILQRSPLVLAWIVFMAIASPCPAEDAVAIPAGPFIAGPIRFQFAVYYLGPTARDPLASLRERAKRIEGGPAIVVTLPDRADKSVLRARVIETVQSDYRPPDLPAVQRFGRGLTREQAEQLQGSTRALILDFVHPATQSPKAMYAALQISEQVARDTGGLLWDEETREVFTPDAWHKRRLESWNAAAPDISEHIVIHAYKSENLVRGITLGMAKFGLPDVVVSDFPWSSNRSVGNLINLFSQAMLEGATLKTPGEYDLDTRSIRNEAVRSSQVGALKPNAVAIAKLTLVKGKWEDGDPRNRLVEIRFDRYPGPDRYARQAALLGAMFGTEDSVARVKHNEELLAASRAANAKLPGLRDAFARGLQPGEYIQVKAPFEVRSGGSEWMWVEVMTWSGDTITGLLKNEPVQIPSLHGGRTVTVSQSKVFDYIRRYPDGREEGNETGKILQRMQGKTR